MKKIFTKFMSLLVFTVIFNSSAKADMFESYYACISDDESLELLVSSVMGYNFVSIEKLNNEPVDDQITVGLTIKGDITNNAMSLKLEVIISDIATGEQTRSSGSLKTHRNSDGVYKGKFKIRGLVSERVSCILL